MGRLSRYITRQILLALTVTVLSLTGAVWMTQATRFLDFAISGGTALPQILELAALTLPNFLGAVLPVGLVVSIAFTYNRLIQDSELVVMRALGIPPARLATPGVLVSLAVALMVLLLEAKIAPASLDRFQSLKNAVRDAVPVNLLRDGAFIEAADGVTVYVDRRLPGGRLLGLYLKDARDPERVVTLMAREGVLRQGAAGPQIEVTAGVQQEANPDPRQIRHLTFERYVIDFSTLVEPAGPRVKRPEAMSLGALFDELGNPIPPQPVSDILRERAEQAVMQPGGRDTAAGPSEAVMEEARRKAERRARSRARRVEGLIQRRLVLPIYAFGLGLVTTGLMVTARINRHGQAGRLAVIAIAATLVQGMALLMATSITRDPSLAWAAWSGAALPFAIGFVLLRSCNRRPEPDRLPSPSLPRRLRSSAPAGAGALR